MPVLENAHGLVVGIANYPNVTKLPASVLRDSMEVYKTLIDPEACAYPQQNVTLLQDEKATGAALRGALADLAAKTDASSIVTIYLSSHGGRIEEGNHRGEYIAPVDARRLHQLRGQRAGFHLGVGEVRTPIGGCGHSP